MASITYSLGTKYDPENANNVDLSEVYTNSSVFLTITTDRHDGFYSLYVINYSEFIKKYVPTDMATLNVNLSQHIGNIHVHAGIGDDIIATGSGADSIQGDDGNDTINGGDGIDAAMYSGNRSDYTITRTKNDVLQIVDNREGRPDGTDTVKNVENFQFNDGTLSEKQLDANIENAAPKLTDMLAKLDAGMEDKGYTIKVADLLTGYTDADKDKLSVTGLTAEHGKLIDNGDGTYTFKPETDYAGEVKLTYKVGDGIASVDADQSFTLSAVNDAPVANDDVALVLQRDAVKGNVVYGNKLPPSVDLPVLSGRDSDVDGDWLSVSDVAANGGAAVKVSFEEPSTTIAGRHGTLNIYSMGSYQYVADGKAPIAVGAQVTDTFTYTVSDGEGGKDTADLVVTVEGTSIGTSGADTFYLTGPGTTATGYAGDDTYYVNASNDRPVEMEGGGDDTVVALSSYKLAAGTEIETLRLALSTGSKGFDLVGNEYANKLVGNLGANVLDGGAGKDVLYGLDGRDTFAFSAKLGAGNLDHIDDFKPVDDTIRLENGIFKGLAAGKLDADAFAAVSSVSAVVSKDTHILYVKETGTLYYDADGAGGSNRTAFAVLDNHASLTFQDFTVV